MKILVIDVPIVLILFGNSESVNVNQAIYYKMASVCRLKMMEMIQKLIVLFQHSLIRNRRNAFLVQKDVYLVQIAILALFVHQTSFMIFLLSFALKNVEMERDTLFNVMMETITLKMDVAHLARSNKAILVVEDHQIAKMFA